MAFCSYFLCFGEDGPSREYWFLCARDQNLHGLPDVELGPREHPYTPGPLVRGHVVLHVHYYGTGAEPDFSRIEHVNVRFAADTPAPAPGQPDRRHCYSSAMDMSLQRKGTCLTGGANDTKMCMIPPWEWDAAADAGFGDSQTYPAYRLDPSYAAMYDLGQAFSPPLAAAPALHAVLHAAEQVRLANAHLLVHDAADPRYNYWRSASGASRARASPTAAEAARVQMQRLFGGPGGGDAEAEAGD